MANIDKLSPTHLFELLDLWLTLHSKPKIKSATYRSYSLTVRYIKEHSKNHLITELKEYHGQNIINKLLKEKYSKSTLDKIKIVLKASLVYAVRNEWIETNPFLYLSVPASAPVKEVVSLTLTEQKKIEKACEYSDYGDATLFLLQTGLRLDELINLKWNDFTPKENSEIKKAFIYIRKSKTKKGVRIVPLLDVAESIILKQRKINAYIFNCREDTPFSATVLSRHNKRLRESTGIENFTNHICRHTFATRAVEKGMNIKALSAILGHSDVSFTMRRYAHADDTFIFTQMTLLEAAMNSNTEQISRSL